MITRRTALAMLPAGLMAGSSFISFARAQSAGPAIKPDPDAARRLVSALDGYNKTPHYEATRPLINFYSQLAILRNNRANSRSKLNTKAELAQALKDLNDIFPPVNTVLDIGKKVDDIIETDKRRRISPQEKTRLRSEIDIKNSRLGDILAELFQGSGSFDINAVRSGKNGAATIARINALTDELLKASIDLSNWGPDAFYAVCRGYATFQFVRDRTRSSHSSPLLARAYTLKVIGDSESYFSLKSASPNAAPPPPPPPVVTGSGPDRLTWTERHDVEKELIDRRFPKQVYLGSQSGRDARCETSGRRIRNFYGMFRDDSSFDRGFRLAGSDGVSVSDCVGTINDRRAEALNNLLSSRTRFPGPTTGNAEQFKQTMRDVEKSLNEHIQLLKRQKEKEDQASGPPQQPQQPPQQPSADDASKEFVTMQQMAAALRTVLALT